ncbi:MAG: hypothetical protein H6718_22910 [Polyangiaceae bacterium]|nr:hypothetical protein [Polyangiaceae bacterium]
MPTIERKLQRTRRIVVLASLAGMLVGAAGLVRVRQHDAIVALATEDLGLHRELAIRLQTYMAEARGNVGQQEPDEGLRAADRELSKVLDTIGNLEAEDDEDGGAEEKAALRELEHEIGLLRAAVAGTTTLPDGRREAVLDHISHSRVQGQLMKRIHERILDEEDDLAQENSRIRTESGVLLALQVVIGLLLALGVHRRLAAIRDSVGGGLRKLTSAAERLGEGTLGEEVRLDTPDAELVTLASTLSTASHALAKAGAEVEQQHSQIVRLEKLSALGQLAGAVGHELRNPLGVIRNAHHYFARRIAMSELAEDKRVNEFLKLVDRELDASARIISDLLDFARERPLDVSHVDLGLLIAEAVEVVPVRANVHVEVISGGDLPALSLDRARMRQVLSNVIQNAVEAIPPERGGTVRIHTLSQSDTCEIRIEDDGEGSKRRTWLTSSSRCSARRSRAPASDCPLCAASWRSIRGTSSTSLNEAWERPPSFNFQRPRPEG